MLADEVRVLPQQMAILTGLSVDALKERRRTRPPKPPHPEPRERAGNAVWYSMASVRHYRAWLAEQANVGRTVAARTLPQSFPVWLNTAAPDERWPISLVGAAARPVDFWATVRGEVSMGRKDSCAWFSATEYSTALASSLNLEAAMRSAEKLAEAAEQPRACVRVSRQRL